MPTPTELFLAERCLEKELQCIYGKVIQDDEDFRATYLYVLTGRGASPADHPAAWREPILQSVGSLSESSSSRRFIGSYIAHNIDLINQVPFTPPRFDFIDMRTNLPIAAINMSKFVYFRYHHLPARELRTASPPRIGRRPDHRDFENYRRAIEMFVSDIGQRTIERARGITSMIVLANVMSEEFKRRCRSIANHFQLETFFYNSVTDDQLYYVFTDFWSSIDFRSLLVSDELPNSPTEQDKWRFQLRRFTKVTFACLARDYFKYCLQVTRLKKDHNRCDSTQPSEREEKLNEEKATYERLCRNLRDYPNITRENEVVRDLHIETLAPPDEDTQLITELPAIEIQEGHIPRGGMIFFDVEKERKRFITGLQKVVDEWRKPPALVLLKDARDFYATRNFLVDCNPPM
ncbi:uncharacterized protein EAE98_007153 [Botrytis deweyae]|uniref:HNH nuclease domain-containing protein n=1 Tax=Botrytis deweyae TaxID=2478750 RepID=A0ABQ7II76_9HELO|nr:uncharacterized protein EAE98_007153 [Botrytis deweyae]KAF7925065.1 hypothetical protein EAE98_007153 [Botrytis deweyae]